MTSSEQQVFRTFRQFLMTPHQMLCFSGPDLAKHGPALKTLVNKEMLVEEKFAGGYSLTEQGFQAMKECQQLGA